MQSLVFHSLPADVVRVSGADRVDLLHRLSTRDLRPLKEAGHATTTLFTTHQGKLLDWVWVLSRPDHLLLQASAERGQALAAWIEKYTIMEEVKTVAEPGWTFMTVWGPGDLLGVQDDVPADALQTSGEGVWHKGLAAMGTPWEGLVPAADARKLAEQLVAQGAAELTPAEMDARRIIAGVPSPRCEYKEEVNPLELRLVNVAVSWNKGCYIGQEVISRLDSYDKVARLTMGFEADEALQFNVEDGAKLTRDGKPLGRVTSCAPHEHKMVGLAVVKREGATPGPAMLETEGGTHPVHLRDCPFWT